MRKEEGFVEVVCIGAGYVGSVTGTAFAVLGHNTSIIDIDLKKVECINSGKSPIFEPGLDRLIGKMVACNCLSASTFFDGVSKADVVFIAVGTPSREDGTADLTYVKSAALTIGKHLNPNKFTVIVTKSTVPVGTADLVTSIIEETSGLREDEHFAVVSNPEFLREGYALEDVFFPDRIVIGTNNPKAKVIMKELYSNLIERINYEEISKLFTFNYDLKIPKAVYFETDLKSSELIKYVSNAFLAIKISYVNEIARLCETLGANVLDVAKGMGLDSRIGKKFLEVSSGWSGSCFPKDTAELLATSQKYGDELALVKMAVQSNWKMHNYCIERIQHQLKTLNGKQIGILGLTFKPNTDDARNTQASYIINKLIDLGANVAVHDPKGMEMFKKLNNHLPIRYLTQPEEVAHRADAILLLTHWDEYKNLDWKHMQQQMKHPYILDTRNFLFNSSLSQSGFIYEGLGIQIS